MRKNIISALVAITLVLCIFTACSETQTENDTTTATATINQSDGDSESDYHPLIMNQYESMLCATIMWEGYFSYDLSEEELFTAFPYLERLTPINHANAAYYNGGELLGITLSIHDPDITDEHFAVTSIRLVGGGTTSIQYPDNKEPTTSDIWGVPVTASYNSHTNHSETRRFVTYEATFTLDGIYHHISFQNEIEYSDSPPYSKWLEFLVNEMIIGSVKDGLKADLSVFDNPEVPELRNEKLTLEQAYADPDFGAYLPDLTGFILDGDARRSLNQHSDSLDISFRLPDYSASVMWKVCRAQEDFHVNPDDYYASYYPTLPVGALTLDVLKTRAYMGNLYFFVSDDIVIEINASIPPEQLWELIEPVIAR
jgi:hypothetical protein